MTLNNMDVQGDILPHLAATGGGGPGGGQVNTVTGGDATITTAGTATDVTVVVGTITPGANGTLALASTGTTDVSLTASAVGAGTTAAKNDHNHALSQAIAPSWTGVHIWETADAGTTNVPIQDTIQHRSSGTPAAAFGTGLLFRLDSAAKTLRDAVEVDAVWSVATDGAEVSSLAISTMLAGVKTQVARLGTGAVLPDVDLSVSLGRALIDSRISDNVYISHRDRTTTSDFGLSITPLGATGLNCASGQSTAVKHNNVNRILVNTTGIGFYNTSPVAQPTITGVKVDAVAGALVVALAALGLVVNSTT